MAKPQHSAALNITILDSPLLIHAIFPTTAHSGNVRAVGITLTHALWSIDIVRAEHNQLLLLKKIGQDVSVISVNDIDLGDIEDLKL